ncbi:hypothetical protein BCR44DRAFT_1501735 [Catenaria anguillulae PL171]|uniref:Ankyrin repeat-containing domain protein n=1 Tax=Catenaria anguillulae PL171 TaxID=765915 RepID=A0A1Y2HG81_9FUNG|nr:hypothetical protein BCR44DRAFT_1501735 [Catenaria anguillulae PL171]
MILPNSPFADGSSQSAINSYHNIRSRTHNHNGRFTLARYCAPWVAHSRFTSSDGSDLTCLLNQISVASLSELTATNDYGITALHCSIYFSLPTLTSAILRRLADLSSTSSTAAAALSTYLQPTPTCPSPLMLAALLGAPDVIRDVHAQLAGKTVAERNRIATICALGEEPGADFAARSWNGTPVFPVELTAVGEGGAASQSESLDATLISSIASRAGWGLGNKGGSVGNEGQVNAAVVGQ